MKFQSTPPARGATTAKEGTTQKQRFQSTPPARGATLGPRRCKGLKLFQSTPPARGATTPVQRIFRQQTFQSTPPARGATGVKLERLQTRSISIHAPREGGDDTLAKSYVTYAVISIHAPREGGDVLPPVPFRKILYFNPRPPRGGRLDNEIGSLQLMRISIHAPREGGDKEEKPT